MFWYQNRDNIDMPKFFIIEDFYRSCNFGLWWIFLNIKSTRCTHQNLFMTFTNNLGFVLNLNLNFWNRLHPKIAFLCIFLTQTATWQPNHTILTWSVDAIWKAMTYTVCLAPSQGGSEFSIYGGRFFQQERSVWGWLAGPPCQSF